MQKNDSTSNDIKSVIQALKKLDEVIVEYYIPIFDFEDEENRLSYFGSLIEETNDINSSNVLGITALMAAAATGRSDIVQMLINAGADVNLQDCAGYTALMFAAMTGSFDLVSLFIDSGANIFFVTIGGYNALLFATYAVDREITQLLLRTAQQQDKERKLEEIVVRVDDGPSELIFVLRDTKIRVNAALLHMLSTRSPIAASNRENEFLDLLMSDPGFNIQSSSDGGIGDIMLAHVVVNGYENIVNKLIGLGVELDSSAWLGATPLILAIQNNDIHMVELLLDAGASVTEKISWYKTPLLIAMIGRNNDVIDCIVQHYIRVNEKNLIDKVLLFFLQI
jgi:ankyrin repeat protein